MSNTESKKVTVSRICTEHNQIGLIYNEFELPMVVDFESGTESGIAPKEILPEQVVAGKHWLVFSLLNYNVENPDFTEQDAVAFGRHLATADETTALQFGRAMLLTPRKASLVVAGILGEDEVAITKAKTFTTSNHLLVQLVNTVLMSYMGCMAKLSRYEENGRMIYRLDIPDLTAEPDWRKVGDYVCSRITSVDTLL